MTSNTFTIQYIRTVLSTSLYCTNGVSCGLHILYTFTRLIPNWFTQVRICQSWVTEIAWFTYFTFESDCIIEAVHALTSSSVAHCTQRWVHIAVTNTGITATKLEGRSYITNLTNCHHVMNCVSIYRCTI